MIKKGLKFIAFIFGLFITLTIGVIIVVKSMINPNDYIDELERSLSTQNVDITIEEDVSWLSLPSFGLKLNKVSLERGNELYSKINEITVRLNYLSLINLPIIRTGWNSIKCSYSGREYRYPKSIFRLSSKSF